jgi:hypothetical protein
VCQSDRLTLGSSLQANTNGGVMRRLCIHATIACALYAIGCGPSGSRNDAGTARASAADTGTVAECQPDQWSTPHSVRDPCVQANTSCSAIGGSGVAPCGMDGEWGQCYCLVPPRTSTGAASCVQQGEVCTSENDCCTGQMVGKLAFAAMCAVPPNQPGPTRCIAICQSGADCQSGCCTALGNTGGSVCGDPSACS